MRYLRAVLSAFVLLTGPAALAQECRVSASGVSFGAIDPTGPRSVIGEGRIVVACGAGKPFLVTMGTGLHSANARQSRKMRSPSGRSFLNYNLYLDSARTRIWGDNSPGSEALSALGTGKQEVYVVHGRIPGNQTVAEQGNYSDSILVTIVW